MDLRTIEKHLETHGVRKTSFRLKLMGVFMASKTALSKREIVQEIGLKIDRVTLYRAIKSFVEKGLIHEISAADDMGLRYAFCKGSCAISHTDNHIHFSCLKCQKTSCVDEVKVPDVALPKGFEVHEFSFVMKGLCKDCS